MSSLDRSKCQAFFVVQSGIVAWEHPNPIVDWKWKTLSVVTKQCRSSCHCYGMLPPLDRSASGVFCVAHLC
jgi:hypothetical protein